MASKLARWPYEIGPVTGREAAMGFLEARKKARHGHRARTHVKDLSAGVGKVDQYLFHVP